MLTGSGRTIQQMNSLRVCIANEIERIRQNGEKENLTKISKQFNCDIRIVRSVRKRIDTSSSVIKEKKSERKKKIVEMNPKSVEDLINIIKLVWESIDQNHIDNLVSSMPRRLSYVKESKGGQIIGHLVDNPFKINGR